MSNGTKTGVFVLVAAVLSGTAWWSGGARMTFDPERFSDQGEPFYPDFTDPLAAASLEVIDYDETSGAAAPFKVEVKNGVWSIPSHYDYPADGKERLAKTASSIIDLRKDIVQSVSSEDHTRLGVVDPLNDTVVSVEGRGQRITLRDDSAAVLADFIVGHAAEGKDGFRYMRLPGKKRTYAVKADIDVSTRFADWIETNLLDVLSGDITSIEILDYAIDEQTRQVDLKDTLVLGKDGADWALEGLPDGEEVDQTVVRRIPTALSGIRITGVRPKPSSLTDDLRLGEGLKLDLGARLSLTSKGFFVSTDGRLLSNEGEVGVGTKDGVRYTLRFGEVVFGEGLEVSAGSSEEGEDAEPQEKGEDTTKTGPENRYLFLTAGFDESLLPPKPTPPEGYTPTAPKSGADEASQIDPVAQATPADQAPPAAPDPQAGDAPPVGDDANGTDEDARKQAEEAARRAAERYERELEAWEAKLASGRKKAEALNNRFARWYYVISGKDFGNIKITRSQLLKAKAAEEKSE